MNSIIVNAIVFMNTDDNDIYKIYVMSLCLKEKRHAPQLSNELTFKWKCTIENKYKRLNFIINAIFLIKKYIKNLRNTKVLYNIEAIMHNI